MLVRATLRSSLRDPDLGTSLYSAGAASSRILFKRLFSAKHGSSSSSSSSSTCDCSPCAFSSSFTWTFVLLVLKRRTTIKEAL